MTKSETREVQKITALMAAFHRLPFIGHERDRADCLAIASRSMATLIRSARSNKSRTELIALADKLELSGHAEFIAVRWN